MPTYHLVMDFGGTKVAAVLYDENFRLISAHRVGSFRQFANSEEQIERHMQQLIDELPLHGQTLYRVSGMIDGRFNEKLSRACQIEQVVPQRECDLCHYAAEIFGDGALALAGTGSHARLQIGETFCGYGGYGALISDEGSGFWIGREALNAAILQDQQRGPATALTDKILGAFGNEGDSLDRALFRIYQKPQAPATVVASCSLLVSQAADEGDTVAIDILRRAGRGLAEQVIAAFKKYRPAGDLPLTVGGSVWKSNATFVRSFMETLHATYPEKPLILPRFEPIIGSILKHCYDENGPLTEEMRRHFEQEFSRYRFTVSPETLSVPFVIQP